MKTSEYWNKRYLRIKAQSLKYSEDYERDIHSRLNDVLFDFEK